jgi:alkylation response protein AidB-like acyl-CoA dehydrogenase
MEALGGIGYCEESELPRLYREMPVNIPAPQPAAVKVAEAVATRDRNGDFAL